MFSGMEVVQIEKEGEIVIQLSSANKLSSILNYTNQLKIEKRIDEFWIKNIDLENLFLMCSKDQV